MYNPVNDVHYARARSNELLREAEQRRLIRDLQPRQPNLLSRLQSQLATWTELAWPRPDRV
jgi:hypothetical protein